jgi:SAM-dependent methyltransferase
MQQADLEAEDVDLGESQYDLVAVCFFLHRPLFPVLRRALRPGGLVVYKTYSADQLKYPGRPRHRMHMLEHNELLREFADFRVLHYTEEWDGKGTAALIARKPETSTSPA